MASGGGSGVPDLFGGSGGGSSSGGGSTGVDDLFGSGGALSGDTGSGGTSGVPDLFGGGSSQKSSGGGNILGIPGTSGIRKAVGGISNVTESLATGIGGYGIGLGEIGLGLAGVPGLSSRVYGQAHDASGRALSGDEQLKKYFPNLFGQAEGVKQTGKEIAAVPQIATGTPIAQTALANYQKDPLGAFLNDAATASYFLPAAGAGMEFAGAGEGALAAARAGEVGQAGEIASQAGRAGQALQTAGRAVRGLGELPGVPFRAAQSGLAGIGARALEAGSEGKLGSFSEFATRFTPQVQKAQAIMADYKASEQAAREAETRRVLSVLSPEEAKAWAQSGRPMPSTFQDTQEQLKATATQALSDAGLLRVGGMGKGGLLDEAGNYTQDYGRQVPIGTATEGGRAGGGGILDTAAFKNSTLSHPLLDDLKAQLADAKATGDKAAIKELQGKLSNAGLYVQGPVAKAMQNMLPKALESGKIAGPIGRIFDLTNAAYLGPRIGWSPQTLLNRAGHASLVFAGADHPVKALYYAVKYGLNPDWLSQEQKEVLSVASDRLEKGGTQGLHTALVDKAQAMIDEGHKVTGTVTKGAAKFMDMGPFYKIAHRIDNATRTGTYLSSVDEKGATDALKEVLRVTGEYDRATQTERDILKRMVPFYQWHREVARMVAHLAEDHPTRLAFAAHMAAISNAVGQSQGLQAGQFKIGGLAIRSSFANPFGEAGSLLQPAGFLGPLAKAGYTLGTGNLASTSKPPSAPAGYPGARAGQLEGPGLKQLPTALNQLAGQIPQVGMLRQAGLLGGPGPRYGVGTSRSKVAGVPLQQPSALQRGLSAAGIQSTPVSQQRSISSAVASKKKRNG